MNNGDMRIHWDAPDGTHLYEDFPCLDDALNRAADVYRNKEGTLTRLENWFGEDACPADQLLPVAMMRADIANRDAENVAMENNPLYGAF